MTEPPAGGFMLPDVNVLVALTNPAHQHHRAAHHWLDGVATFATTPLTEAGLIRLLLNRTVTGQEVTGRQAIGLLGGLRAHDRSFFLPDRSSLVDARIDLIGLVGHKQATDFHLVNLAASAGGTLASFDRRIVQSLAGHDQRHVHVI